MRYSKRQRTGRKLSLIPLFPFTGEPLRGDRLVKGGKRIGLQHGLLKRTGKEIPKVPQSSSDNQRRDSSFPIYSHALRPFNSTEDLYQDNARGFRLDNQYQQIQTHSAILPGVLGVPSRLRISKVSPASATRERRQNPFRQHHHSGVSKQARRHAIRDSDVFCYRNPESSRKSPNIPYCTAHKRGKQPAGRLLKSTHLETRGVVPKPADFSGYSIPMGSTSSRSLRHKKKQKSPEICLPISSGSSGHSGRSSSPLAVQSSICFSADHTAAPSHSQNQNRRSEGDTNSSILAQETMVLVAANHVGLRSLGPPLNTQSSLPGSVFPPSSGQSTSHGLEFERQMLKSRGFSEGLINTLLQSRKPSTTKIYTKIWKKFLQFHTSSNTSEIPIQSILEFLQKGRELGLTANTLKVHVSALGALYGHNIAGNRWVSRFITACERINPVNIPRVPPWDLNLVLQALTDSPFEPIDSIPIKILSLKTALLVALTSARRISDSQALSIDPPFLLTFQDKLVLKPDPSYLPKVAKTFHRSQEIILPTFFSNPSTPEEQKYHTLDVKRVVLKYIERTCSWRQCRALFISFQGHKKGHGITKSTLSRWIRESIRLAYSVSKENPPEGITAHSTRAMASSWAERGEVPIETICKAATWSNPSTFYNHYRLDLSSTSDLDFGRTVLSTVVPP
ncbi:uncharacterized protein [Ranitomeya imitator]|uniref:uncharacterized protein isoform X2 n=1 Tax=Ranitomeya imitator TaxID=111125 RepID=UPI0037E85BAE